MTVSSESSTTHAEASGTKAQDAKKRPFYGCFRFACKEGEPGHTTSNLDRIILSDTCSLYVPPHARSVAQDIARTVLQAADLASMTTQELLDYLTKRWVAEGYKNGLASPVILIANDAIALLRDALGIESLWYAIEDSDVLHVASRPQDVGDRLQSPARASSLGVIDWAHHGLVLPPRSPLDGVSAVEQGGAVVIDRSSGAVDTRIGWDTRDAVDPDLHRKLAQTSVPELEKVLEDHLDIAVQQCVDGAENVGVLLSGGVDSSLLTALLRRHTTPRAVTVTLPEVPEKDEGRYARWAAESLGVEMYEYPFTKQSMRTHILKFVQDSCSPVIVENSIAQYACVKSGVFDGCDLMVDGEGSDRLFSVEDKWSSIAFALTESFGAIGRGCVSGIEAMRKAMARLGIRASLSDDRPGLSTLLGAREMETWHQCRAASDRLCHVAPRDRLLEQLRLATLYYRLPALLWRLELCSHLSRCRVQYPYLDSRVQCLAMNIPLKYKARWRTARRRVESKWILKRIAAKHLPAELIYRPKMGFGVPGAAWLPKWPEEWRREPWVAETFGLSTQALGRFLHEERMSRDYFYLTTVEMFGRLYGWRVPFDNLEAEWSKACSEDL